MEPNVVDFYAWLTALAELAGEHRLEALGGRHQDEFVGVEKLALDQKLHIREFRVVDVLWIWRKGKDRQENTPQIFASQNP